MWLVRPSHTDLQVAHKCLTGSAGSAALSKPD
jgi:hypothetical protein